MTIEGQSVLVLGGGGMVGRAVCSELLAHGPGRLVVAARRAHKAQRAVEALRAEHPGAPVELVPAWGDVFLRAEWQTEAGDARAAVLADPERRRRLIQDVAQPLTDDLIAASLLGRLILGAVPALGGARADVVIDCMNTATAVGYQNVYALTQRLAALAEEDAPDTDWPGEVEALLAALSVPQLVRHVQLLYAAMRRAGTRAYVKVGTSGTGGLGFNIPYTHGEERPSRLLLSKAALAGAQSLLTFLLARTPDGPPVVREVKPAALIGWRAIGFGPITQRGREVPLVDCAPEEAVPVREPASRVREGAFGHEVGGRLEGVFVDTGENGLYAADEFAAITALGQMEMVTPEEVAQSVVRELVGSPTGRDVVSALDGAVLGPTFRGGYLREAALTRLRQLEEQHGKAVAFERLGPPRLTKLLFEGHLLERAFGTAAKVAEASPDELASAAAAALADDPRLRQRILSIGIGVLLPDGERLLRGPTLKAEDAHHGWVDLTPANMAVWRTRLAAVQQAAQDELDGDTSSRSERLLAASRAWRPERGFFALGEVAAWVFLNEEGGRRAKR